MKSSEIPKFHIDYYNTKTIDTSYLEKQYVLSEDDIKNNYNPFHLDKIQIYNPSYNMFFKLAEDNYNNVGLNHKYCISNLINIIDQETKEPVEKNIFIKYSPLLDPLKYMIGKYKNDETIYVLPSIHNNGSHPKLLDTNNASYVDNLFSFLSSKLLHSHGFLHGVDYYGSFLGVQQKFKINVIDDLDYLSNSDYFKENINKMFSIADIEMNEFSNFGSGVMFLPSGLAYYNQIPSALIPSYSPLIFSFKLKSQKSRDHDRDGILSKYEVNPTIANQKPKDYDSDGDGIPNYYDIDDDIYLTCVIRLLVSCNNSCFSISKVFNRPI
jgi:hypothetical protein